MPAPDVTSRDINKLTDVLEKLITTIGKGGFSGGNKGGASGKTQVDSEQKISKILTKKLKDNQKYLDILEKIEKNTTANLKLGVENEKLDKQKLIYIKKQEELEKLQNANTISMKKAQEVAHRKMLKTAEDDYKREANKYKLIEKEVKLEKDKAKIIEETAAENAKAIAKEEAKERNREKRKEAFDNIQKATGKYLLKQASSALDIMLDADSAISKLSANYGLSKDESGALKKNIGEIAWKTQLIGVGTGDLVKMQSSYTDQMGRSVMLGKENMVTMAQTSVALGIGVEATGQMASDMNLFGSGVADSMVTLSELSDLSKKSGVSLTVAAKKFENNLKLANTYNFKNGIDGVKTMSVYATKMGIKMESVASFADKISSPEGALQTAASLQVLGGAFSQMADPMKLMNQGITDMEGLTETYSKMLDGVISIDKKTGKLNENGYEKIRIKAAAEAAGISFDDMMTAARTKAQRQAITHDVSLNTNIKTDEQKDLLATLATFDSKKGGYSVNVNGTQKSIAKLDAKDLQAIKPEKVKISDIAENTLGIKEILDNGLKALLTAIVGQLLPAVNLIAKYILQAFHFLMPTVENGSKGISNVANSSMGGKVLGDVGQMAAKGLGVKAILGMGGNLGSRAIPGIGGLVDAGFAINDFRKGRIRSGLLNSGAAIANGLGAASVIGAPLGAGIGLGLNAINTGWDIHDALHPDSAQDLLIPSGGGRPIKLNNRDDVYAMKPGGAIEQAIMPRNESSTIFKGVSPSFNNSSNSGLYNSSNNNHKVDHTGVITLQIAGGNSAQIDINELMKNPEFIKKISRKVGQSINKDQNGGAYNGPLGPDSF